ncbi:MAG: polyphosphate kinase 1, partial [Hyphomicrobiales bacterium]
RALTWLGFDLRVLEEALDTESPILERARFLGIAISNLDEFFMIRVAGVRELIRAGVAHKTAAGRTPAEQMESIAESARALFEAANAAWVRDVEPLLRESGVRFVGGADLAPRERAFLDRLFAQEILPVLTPAAIHPDMPVPRLSNLAIHLAVRLGRAGEAERLAVVQMPRPAARWIQVGGGAAGSAQGAGARFVLIEDVVRERLGDLFQGYDVLEAAAFRVTRDADFATDDQEAEDLVEAVRQVLRHRMHGDPVRLEIERGASEALTERVRGLLGLDPIEVYRAQAPLDLRFLMDFARLPSLPAPRAKAWPPQAVPDLPPGEALWDAIVERERLLFHPYETFEPVLRLLRLAAEDPAVLAIKQILYRTSSTSEIVRALERAAENGKQVTVLVELQARFDEERNVGWARRLEDAGAQVLYGLAGLKTHAKALLIVRRGANGIERYAHVGTGNYNERTVLEYSDLSLLSADEDLCADLTGFFNVVTGVSEPLAWRRIAMAPLGLRSRFLSLIRREIDKSTPEEPGRIRAKMNALVDVKLVDALYEASKAGVRVDLNVRGSCLLRPGVPGLSDNIRVVTVVDRFLEHSRIFEFRNGGDPEVLIGSADWMPRNLDRRVELVISVADADHRERLSGILDVLFADNVKARELKADGTLGRRDGRRKPFRAQEAFWEEAHARASRAEDPDRSVFQPLKRAPAAG